jgi:hypothetical protein
VCGKITRTKSQSPPRKARDQKSGIRKYAGESLESSIRVFEMRLFAVASPGITWIFFSIFLYYGFGGSTSPSAFFSNIWLWIGALAVTAIVGCCASYIYFRKEPSKLPQKILYLTSFVHGFLVSNVFFCSVIEYFFERYFERSWLYEIAYSISRFFGWISEGLFLLTFPAVWGWFIVVVAYYFIFRSTPMQEYSNDD